MSRFSESPVYEVEQTYPVADVTAFEVAIDRVAGLGDFVEFELQADAAGIDAAANRVESPARALGCGSPERRSCLEPLLERGEGAITAGTRCTPGSARRSTCP